MNEQEPSRSRAALRRLLVIAVVAIAVLVYAYGWQVTDIDLAETQDEVRQDSVTRAMRELLSPDLFDQERETETAFANFQIGDCAEEPEPLEQPAREEGAPYIVFSPECAEAGDIVIVEGFDFHPSALGQVRMIRASGQKQPFGLASIEDGETESGNDTVSVFDIDEQGRFTVNVFVPLTRQAVYETEALGSWAVGTPFLSVTTNTVIEKMIETIFLALMSTTLALPIAIALSFPAARNLMRQVNAPFGNVLVGFILLPVGWWLGTLLLEPIGTLGVRWGKDPLLGVLALVVAFPAYGLGLRAVNNIKLDGILIRLRTIILNIALALLLLFALGVIGGFIIWVGAQLEVWGQSIATGLTDIQLIVEGDIVGTLIAAFGGFLGTLGELVDSGIGTIAAVFGAFLISTIGMSLTVGLLKNIRGITSYGLGGVLGGVSGAALLWFVASIGELGALLGLFAPFVAALLGGEVFALVYTYLLNSLGRERDVDALDQMLHRGLSVILTVILFLGGVDILTRVVSLDPPVAVVVAFLLAAVVFTVLYRSSSTTVIVTVVGAIGVFALTYVFLDVARGVVDGRLPSAITWLRIESMGLEITEYHRNAIIIGGILGGLGGLLAGTHTIVPLGMVMYNTTRTILNALRSIEPLIMGIVFVIWVGIGPFAGVLALALHSIAALGKLYSEQVESIDAGPIEAILATGANRLQMIIYAVVPQIVPPYIAFTFYRWDINVRMSTIIGFVGGGGIGFLLQQQINLLRYRQAGVAVLAIAIVVSVLDYISAVVRERLV